MRDLFSYRYKNSFFTILAFDYARMDALFREQHLEVDIQLWIAARGGVRAVNKGRRDSI